MGLDNTRAIPARGRRALSETPLPLRGSQPGSPPIPATVSLAEVSLEAPAQRGISEKAFRPLDRSTSVGRSSAPLSSFDVVKERADTSASLKSSQRHPTSPSFASGPFRPFSYTPCALRSFSSSGVASHRGTSLSQNVTDAVEEERLAARPDEPRGSELVTTVSPPPFLSRPLSKRSRIQTPVSAASETKCVVEREDAQTRGQSCPPLCAATTTSEKLSSSPVDEGGECPERCIPR
jgi:hypothetical protein